MGKSGIMHVCCVAGRGRTQSVGGVKQEWSRAARAEGPERGMLDPTARSGPLSCEWAGGRSRSRQACDD